jgi:hypothetical protein
MPGGEEVIGLSRILNRALPAVILMAVPVAVWAADKVAAAGCCCCPFCCP